MIDGRSAHKADTRRALIEAALDLFATKGYEATSTDEIAERAGVSPRTFFRYFETKDRVLFFGGDAFNENVVRALPAQPAGLDDVSALAATIDALVPLVEPLKERIRRYFASVDASAVLLGQHVRSAAEHDVAVALALARRRRKRQPDERSRLAAQLGSLATERAYRTWLSGRRPLRDVMAESFALVRDVAGESAQPSAPLSR